MHKRILVPVDGSDTSLLGLKEAIRLAKNRRCQVGDNQHHHWGVSCETYGLLAKK